MEPNATPSSNISTLMLDLSSTHTLNMPQFWGQFSWRWCLELRYQFCSLLPSSLSSWSTSLKTTCSTICTDSLQRMMSALTTQFWTSCHGRHCSSWASDSGSFLTSSCFLTPTSPWSHSREKGKRLNLVTFGTTTYTGASHRKIVVQPWSSTASSVYTSLVGSWNIFSSEVWP